MRPTSLEKFKQIYLQTYGVQLEDQEAFDLAENLLGLYRAVYLEEPHKNINQNYEKNVLHPQH